MISPRMLSRALVAAVVAMMVIAATINRVSFTSSQSRQAKSARKAPQLLEGFIPGVHSAGVTNILIRELISVDRIHIFRFQANDSEMVPILKKNGFRHVDKKYVNWEMVTNGIGFRLNPEEEQFSGWASGQWQIFEKLRSDGYTIHVVLRSDINNVAVIATRL
jgi:hypothetical protein